MRYMFVLGNGFSLDLLHYLGSESDVPLSNLAAHGDKLAWPADGKSAFISFRNTPNLWILGVRPSNPQEQNNRIIENIITCANAYYLKSPATRSFGSADKRSIYIDAYRELVVYLKYLFIQFDDDVEVSESTIANWPWAKLLLELHNSSEVANIDVVTFNYDIWLERTLDALSVPYQVEVISPDSGSKFSITKPHGSISFVHTKHLDPAAFSINYTSDYLEGDVNDFIISMSDLKKNTPIIPLIPPAGDSKRFDLSWAGKLRANAVGKAKLLGKGDRIVLCGLSYWHVDRGEIDDILLNVSDEVDIAYINPHPPETFDAVLTSLFSRYEHYISINPILEGAHNA